MKGFIKKFEIAGALLAMFISAPVFADDITLPNPIGTNNFLDVTNTIISFLFVYIAIPLCTIMALVGGFQLMTSAGNPEKASQGRKTLLYAAIGFMVVLIATGITSIIKSILGVS